MTLRAAWRIDAQLAATATKPTCIGWGMSRLRLMMNASLIVGRVLVSAQRNLRRQVLWPAGPQAAHSCARPPSPAPRTLLNRPRALLCLDQHGVVHSYTVRTGSRVSDAMALVSLWEATIGAE